MPALHTTRFLVALIVFTIGCPLTAAAVPQRRGDGGGGDCTVTVTPATIGAISVGETLTVTVTAVDMYCSWEVVSEADWIVPDPTSGYGSGSVRLTVSPAANNLDCQVRSGTVRINGAQVLVTQSGPFYANCFRTTTNNSIGCCAIKAASLVSRGGDSIALARRYRDEVLLKSPLGATYVRAYYDHTDEAVRIASSDPWLLLRTARALKRHTPTLQRAVDGHEAAITDEDLEEFDALAAEYEAAASPSLRATLSSFRNDLRHPERLGGVGVRIHRNITSRSEKSVDGDAVDGFDERLIGLAPADAEVATRLLRVPDFLAVASRTGHYGRWYARHGSSAVSAVAGDPLLALRLGGVATRLMTSLDTLVETGSARIDQTHLDDLGAVLDRLADRLDSDAASTVRLARRDLRSRHTLAGAGIVVDRDRYAFAASTPRTGKVAGAPAAPSGFLGGTGDDAASAVTVDTSGNIIVVGATAGSGFTTVNAIQPEHRGAGDAFVTKFSPDGQIVFSTYLGGSRADVASAVATDAAGNIYVSGTTESSNFPAPGGYQRGRRGTADAFVVKFDPTGSTILYGTYLGGNLLDGATAIAVDATGRVYVTGATISVDFPVTTGVVDREMTGVVDAFVTRLSPAGSAIEASTLLGGQGRDGASSIGLDPAGNVVVAGVTSSLDFPQIMPVQAEFGGLCDGFVTKLSSGLNSFVFSTWIGGSDVDGVGGAAVDSTGAVVITGATASAADFPLRSAIQDVYGGGFLDAFVSRIPSTGGSVEFSTYLGGTDDDRGYRVAVDGSGGISLVGLTASANFPTAGAQQSSLGGGVFDAFVTQLTPTGTGIRMSTFIGGAVDESGVGIAVASSGVIVAAGETSSPDFPASASLGAFDGGPSDGFVVAIAGAPQVPPPVVDSVTGLVSAGKPYRVKIVGSNFQSGAAVYIGGSSTEWANLKRKGDTQLLLRKGSALEAVFPAGVATEIRIVNPDGGVATVTFRR